MMLIEKVRHYSGGCDKKSRAKEDHDQMSQWQLRGLGDQWMAKELEELGGQWRSRRPNGWPKRRTRGSMEV